jgi:hypothetical protein
MQGIDHVWLTRKNVLFLPFLKRYMKKLLFSVIFVLSAGWVSAQSQEIGLFAGGSYYLGDINPGYHFMMTRPAFGAVIRYNYGTRWAFRISGLRGRVEADDAVSKVTDTRNLKFKSKITEISATAEFNFFDYYIGSKKNIVTPFIFGGAGVFFYDPESDGVDLRSLGTEGQNVGFDGRKPYGKISFAIPFGLGLKYSFSRRFGIAAEWGLRKTFTDYIDDVSTTYYLDGTQISEQDPEQILSDPTKLHQPYMERGNPRNNDWYAFTGLSLTYKFNLFKGKGCPDQR